MSLLVKEIIRGLVTATNCTSRLGALSYRYMCLQKRCCIIKVDKTTLVSVTCLYKRTEIFKKLIRRLIILSDFSQTTSFGYLFQQALHLESNFEAQYSVENVPQCLIAIDFSLPSLIEVKCHGSVKCRYSFLCSFQE